MVNQTQLLTHLPETVLRKAIKDIGLSRRSFNALCRHDVRTVAELLQLTDEQLLRFKNFGKTSLKDVRDAIAKLSQDDNSHPDQFNHFTANTISTLSSEMLGNNGWAIPQTIKGSPETDVALLGLSVRAQNILNKLGIQCVGELAGLSTATLEEQLNCGRKTVNEIHAKLCKYLERGESLDSGLSGNLQHIGTRTFVDKVLSTLPERSRSVVADRFGLWDGIAETLQDIGDKLGLTRERIRQIEAKSLKSLRRQFGPTVRRFVEAKVTEKMKIQEGCQTEDELLQAFSDDCNPSEAALALGILRGLRLPRRLRKGTAQFGRELTEVESGVYCANAENAKNYKVIVALIKDILTEHRTPINEHKLWNQILQRQTPTSMLSQEQIKRVLYTSAAFSILQNGSVLLSRWAASRPARIAILCEGALQKLDRPAHFTEVANQIYEIYPDGGNPTSRSVHNILVSRRDIFVWVKNGTYGLLSWGLKQPPYIKNRLIQILSESSYPLPYWFLKQKTLEVCNCKEASVRMTLDLNPRIFRRFADDQYGLVQRPKS